MLVHHGLFWDRDSRVVDPVMKGRLKALFDHDLTLAAYHLALDAHPEVGNNALLARELGVKASERFTDWGYGGPLEQPRPDQRVRDHRRRRASAARRSSSPTGRSRSSASPS